jgi:hypothetical protein
MIDLDVQMPYREPVSILLRFRLDKPIKNMTIFENGIHEGLVLRIHGDELVLVVNQNEVFRVPVSFHVSKDHFIALVFSNESLTMYVNDTKPVHYKHSLFPEFRDFFPLNERVIQFLVVMDTLNHIQVLSFYNHNAKSEDAGFKNVLVDFQK